MNTTKNKHPKKDLKAQGLSPKKLLKIALVVLMIVPLGYFFVYHIGGVFPYF